MAIPVMAQPHNVRNSFQAHRILLHSIILACHDTSARWTNFRSKAMLVTAEPFTVLVEHSQCDPRHKYNSQSPPVSTDPLITWLCRTTLRQTLWSARLLRIPVQWSQEGDVDSQCISKGTSGHYHQHSSPKLIIAHTFHEV